MTVKGDDEESLRTVKNIVEWKSDNCGIKGTTFIQTGRRGTDVEGADPSPMCG